MQFREIERHAQQSVKIRTELRCGRTPWQLIRKPKGMRTSMFNGKIERLRHHEREYKRKLAIYFLQ